MISRMRPRKPLVSGDAPISATDFGQSSFPMSGTRRLSRQRGDAAVERLTQAETAGDNAAQHLRCPALNGEFRCNHRGEGKLLFQSYPIGHFRLEKSSKLTHASRQLLFPQRTDVFDDRALDDWFLAGLQ